MTQHGYDSDGTSLSVGMLSFQIDTQLTKDLIALNEMILEKHAFLETLPKDEKDTICSFFLITSRN